MSGRKLAKTKRQLNEEITMILSQKKSQAINHEKFPSYFIADITPLWISLGKQKDVKWYFQINYRKIYTFTNHRSSTPPRKKNLVVTCPSPSN